MTVPATGTTSSGRAAGSVAPDAAAGAVLALRALGLGDALTGVPALRALRRRFPGRPLVVACSPAVGRLLVHFGVVDGWLATAELDPLPPMPAPYLAVDLHGRGPASHAVVAATGARHLLTFASPEAGYPRGPRWEPDEHEVWRWLRLVGGIGAVGGREDLRLGDDPDRDPTGPVVVHPGAASASRRWPVERWAGVVDDLLRRGRTVVLTGSGAERTLTRALIAAVPAGLRGGIRDTAGDLNLIQLTATVAAASLLLSGDTGAGHLATATGTPSVLLFGPTPPQWWGPILDRDRHRVLWPAAADHRGDPHGDRIDPVLAAITVGTVLRTCDALLHAPTSVAGPPATARTQRRHQDTHR